MADDISKNKVADGDKPGSDTESTAAQGTRRSFFEVASVVIGAIVGIGPAVIGLLAFIDPLRRKPAKPGLYREDAAAGGDGLIRVASIDALSVAAPQRFPVIDDQIDAWNFTPDQPVGAVYVEKLESGGVRVFNTTCPHAGCSVACNGTAYHCPCHNSSFNLDGSKMSSDSGRENPSPRDLDSLDYEIRDGEIWVDFKNFYTGKHEKKEKA